jgi:hypothetical protein
LNFHFWKGETLGVDETEFNTQQIPSFSVRLLASASWRFRQVRRHMGDFLATGPNFPLVISQTPGGELQDLRREQSDCLGIVDEKSVGAVFLIDKCRQRIQVGAFCCHPKFDFDRNSNTRGVRENEVHFRPASRAIVLLRQFNK